MVPPPPPPPRPSDGAHHAHSQSEPIPVHPASSSSPASKRQAQPQHSSQHPQQHHSGRHHAPHGHPSSREQRHRENTDLAPPRPSGGAGQQRFGHYVIIKTLGEGSFGKVKLAVHQNTGQKVALKIISRRKLINKDMAGRVEREIQYLQLLRHPHIIKLYANDLPAPPIPPGSPALCK